MIEYKSNSREHQDFFVLSVLDKKQKGTYVEIGAAAPIDYNNTYLLESSFNWTGVSVEWDPYMVNLFNSVRKNSVKRYLGSNL